MTDWLTEHNDVNDAELCSVEAQIVVYRDAITARATGVQQYRIDTGQTQNQVIKATLAELRATYEFLLKERDRLREAVDGSSSHYARPGW